MSESRILLEKPVSFSNDVKIPRPLKNPEVHIAFTKDTGLHAEVIESFCAKKKNLLSYSAGTA